ncbi:MAG: glycosyltransferase [Spirosomataceae bacterium]
MRLKKNIEKDANPLIMVMSARFQAQKDHETLINALVPIKNLNWELMLLGDGELMPIIKEKVNNLNLSEKVFFEGAVNNVPKYLEEADIFLLITNWEGLPISILEAMAHSLPIIATDVAGVKEEVLNGVNGFLVPRKDSKSITSSILHFYNDRQLAVQMGQKSREHFEKNFTIDIMVENTLRLYKEIIDNKN